MRVVYVGVTLFKNTRKRKGQVDDIVPVESFPG
jgi:hypothetical protein